MATRIFDSERARQLQMLEEQILQGDHRIKPQKRAPEQRVERERRKALRLVAEARVWRSDGAEEMVRLCSRGIRIARMKARLYAGGVIWADINAVLLQGVPWSRVEAELLGARK